MSEDTTPKTLEQLFDDLSIATNAISHHKDREQYLDSVISEVMTELNHIRGGKAEREEAFKNALAAYNAAP